MLKLFRYLKRYFLQVILLLILIGVQAWATMQLPALMADIINQGIMAGDMNYVWRTGGWMIGLAVLTSACAFASNYLSARIGTAFARDVREDFFRKVLSLSVVELDEFSTASLITRTTNDIAAVQQAVVLVLSMAIRAPMMCIMAIAQAIATAPDMTWIMVLAVLVILGLFILIISIVMPKFTLLRKLADKITLLARENLTGLRVIRAFNNEKLEQKKFERTNSENAKWTLWVDTIMSLETPLVSLVMNGVMLLCIWIGISLISKDFAYLGNMMAFMQYAIHVVMSFLLLTMLFVMLPRASVSAKRVNEVLGAKSKIKWQEETIGKPSVRPRVEFRKVGFSYRGAGEKVLENISFVAEAGETTAFIGSTGSGKSTLINLVPRFYEATEGEILVNNVPLKDYAEKDLMQRIGYVPQRGRLFAGTVRSNILFGVDPRLATKTSSGTLKAARPSLWPEEVSSQQSQTNTKQIKSSRSSKGIHGQANTKQIMPEEVSSQQFQTNTKQIKFSRSSKGIHGQVATGQNDLDGVMKKAAEVAQASEFIEKMEGKYEARIAQGGTNVSGGQRQRLSIARAIAKDPDIYIFDDAFSALDMKTDAKLREALKPITKEAVTLIVAQRIGTIRDAEQIIVLDQGKMVGKGKHEELLRDCEVYREIAKSQLSDAEFAAEMKAVEKTQKGDKNA